MADPNAAPVDTAEELNTPITVTVDAGTPVSAPTVGAVDDLGGAVVSAPAAPTFTPRTPSDTLSEANLNINVQTLGASVTARLQELSNQIGGAGLAKAADVKARLDALIGNMNTALGVLAGNVNARFSTTASNINTLAGVIALVDEKVMAIDEVFGLNAGDIAAQLTSIQQFFDSLSESDMDLVGALDAAIDELNSRPVHRGVEVMVTASNGIYSFALLDHGFPEQTVDDYVVTAQVIGNPQAMAYVTAKTSVGCAIEIKSNGVHVTPQPVDCATTPVKVAIGVTHAPVHVLTFGVDVINSGSVVGDPVGTHVENVGA
ncbi:hypothetical protein [Endothiovibrio diazotrophicus]